VVGEGAEGVHERPGPIFGGQHDRALVGRPRVQLPGDDDEPGLVLGVVGDLVGEDLEAVEPGGERAGNRATARDPSNMSQRAAPAVS